MNFDEIIDRRGTHSAKWDKMQALFGVSPDEGIPMWVADMDFRPPETVAAALQAMIDHGIFGYFGDDSAYLDAIRWWHRTRHGWEVEPEWILTVHGLVNGTSVCVDTFTRPGDGVILMTPVYHAFHKVLAAADRRIVQCEMPLVDGRYELDIPAWDAQLDGSEKMLVLCSPHNPVGRVFTRDELERIGDFCRRHDLILVSDEIHHDLVMPGIKHTPMALIPGLEDRLVMMASATKTFNLAGIHTGNIIVPDPGLRAAIQKRMLGLGLSPNAFGMHAIPAAYSPEGAAWVDELMAYLDGNRQVFDAAMNALPGVRSVPLEATYLAWVDFTGTGMDEAELLRRVQEVARVAPNHGPTFGKGGEGFLRFNIATPRARVEDACARLTDAFADLQ